MQIHGADSMSLEQLEDELVQGGRFVVYSWCISILILTFKNPSDIYFIRGAESRFLKGLPFTFISLFAGWWGFPFGPIFTIWSIIGNLSGGKDVTDSVLVAMRESYRQQEAEMAAWERTRDADPYADMD